MNIRILAVAACALFSLSACQPTSAPEGGATSPSPVEAAGSIATAASNAALLEAAKPGATRDSILSAALAAATSQALLVAPSAIDPGWQEAIRSAVALAIVLSKSDEGPPHVDGNKAYAEVDRVVRAKLAK